MNNYTFPCALNKQVNNKNSDILIIAIIIKITNLIFIFNTYINKYNIITK